MNKIIVTFLGSLLIVYACKNNQETSVVEDMEVKEEVVDMIDLEQTVEEEVTPKLKSQDTITIEGTLISISESDFWGRIYLNLDVAGQLKSFTYLTYSIDRNKEIEKLINKKVSLAYYTEVTIEEDDIHFNGVGIHGKYSSVQKEEDIRNYGPNIIEGIITVTSDDLSGDLPSSYWMTKSDGSKVEVVAFVYEEYISHNGEKATVFFNERHTDLVVSIAEMEEEISSRYHYDEDFEVFKTAVINKDIKGVSAFASSDMIDAEVIIEAFSDPVFLKQLKAGTYNDLTTDTSGKEVFLVFTATVQGDAGNGEVFESGLYLYFSQGETSLLLENFFAAG